MGNVSSPANTYIFDLIAVNSVVYVHVESSAENLAGPWQPAELACHGRKRLFVYLQMPKCPLSACFYDGGKERFLKISSSQKSF
jgi:hypothetical protein